MLKYSLSPTVTNSPSQTLNYWLIVVEGITSIVISDKAENSPQEFDEAKKLLELSNSETVKLSPVAKKFSPAASLNQLMAPFPEAKKLN